jgi:hypothetical protein
MARGREGVRGRRRRDAATCCRAALGSVFGGASRCGGGREEEAGRRRWPRLWIRTSETGDKGCLFRGHRHCALMEAAWGALREDRGECIASFL